MWNDRIREIIESLIWEKTEFKKSYYCVWKFNFWCLSDQRNQIWRHFWPFLASYPCKNWENLVKIVLLDSFGYFTLFQLSLIFFSVISQTCSRISWFMFRVFHRIDNSRISPSTICFFEVRFLAAFARWLCWLLSFGPILADELVWQFWAAIF